MPSTLHIFFQSKSEEFNLDSASVGAAADRLGRVELRQQQGAPPRAVRDKLRALMKG